MKRGRNCAQIAGITISIKATDPGWWCVSKRPNTSEAARAMDWPVSVAFSVRHFDSYEEARRVFDEEVGR